MQFGPQRLESTISQACVTQTLTVSPSEKLMPARLVDMCTLVLSHHTELSDIKSVSSSTVTTTLDVSTAVRESVIRTDMKGVSTATAPPSEGLGADATGGLLSTKKFHQGCEVRQFPLTSRVRIMCAVMFPSGSVPT